MTVYICGGLHIEDLRHPLIGIVYDIKMVFCGENPRTLILSELCMVVGATDMEEKCLPAPLNVRVTAFGAGGAVDLVILIRRDEEEHLKSVGRLLLEACRELGYLFLRVAPRVENREEVVEVDRHFVFVFTYTQEP
jgi:hypothetical protein